MEALSFLLNDLDQGVPADIEDSIAFVCVCVCVCVCGTQEGFGEALSA
jgi:hypothetical protein